MDPIADMLTMIRNANERYHKEVVIPGSKLKLEIVKILADEGYISHYQALEQEGKTFIKIGLKYKGKRGKERVISGLERVSKPGRRIYAGVEQIPKVLNGLGITILSTPQGVMTGKEARRRRIGGEVICNVW